MGVVSYNNDAPERGIEQRLLSLKRLKRPIDFAIGNKESLILRQRVIRKCGISDHLPTRVKVCMKVSCTPAKERFTFDRTSLENLRVKKRLEMELVIASEKKESIEELLGKFMEKLNKILEEEKVISKTSASEKGRV